MLTHLLCGCLFQLGLVRHSPDYVREFLGRVGDALLAGVCLPECLCRLRRPGCFSYHFIPPTCQARCPANELLTSLCVRVRVQAAICCTPVCPRASAGDTCGFLTGVRACASPQ